MSDFTHVVFGVDAAGIDHGKEFPDTTDGRWEAEQHHLKLLGMARKAEAQGQAWQQWPGRTARGAVGTPRPKEANGDDHWQKPRSNLPPKRRQMPYQD